ncbi:MAG: tetratricopeptide repeat protein [Planctomycetes bacterium]|nr:tetratricopeptide repeat protein [Planctomycetota bacterium]
MSDTIPSPDPQSDLDFSLARRAVERGWLAREQVEAALQMGGSLLARLPLSAEQIRELATPSRPAPPEAAEAMKEPANRVGRYWRLNPLGSGGMGMVFRAWDPDLGRWVALKFLKQIGDEKARAFFRREAQLAASLDHPNIAKIYEVGEHDGNPFIAMQFVDGETLSKAKLKAEERLRAAGKIAEAVRFAHDRGVIHRDLKPANVMVEKSGAVYVMDFGLAKETAVEGESLTGTNVVVGTPNYMAPEQARGRAEKASDLYGIGAILYELVTGRPPFVGESSAEVLTQVVTAEPVRPKRLAPGTPADLEAIIVHALEKDPRRRYAGAVELIDDLDALAQKNPLRHARRVTWSYVLAKRIRKQPLIWATTTALALAAVAGAAAGITFLFRARREAEKAAAETARRLEQEVRASRERDEAKRRESGLQRLATLWHTVVERKQELRSGRVPHAAARRDLEKSEGDVSRYVEEWPGHPEGYYVRARARLYLGDLDGAGRDLEAALAKAASFRPGRTLLGMVRIQQYLVRLVGQSDTDPDRVALAKPVLEDAVRHFAAGWEPGREQEEAERWGLPWSRDDRVAVRVAQALRSYYADNSAPRAARILKEGLAEYESEEFLTQLSHLAGKTDEALALLTRAIALAPGWEVPHFHRGILYYERKDFAASLRDFDRAIALKPDWADAVTNRGVLKGAMGDHKGALVDSERAVELRPSDPAVYYHRALTRQNLGDNAGAVKDYDRAIELKKDYAEAYTNRGNARLALGDPDGAMRDYDRAIELKEYSPWAYNSRGTIKRDRGDLRGAIKDFDAAIRLDPAQWQPFSNRGNAKRELGDLPGAVADYDEALRRNPDWVQGYENRARTKLANGDGPGAVADYDRLLERRQGEAGTYVERARAKARAGDLPGARADLDRVIGMKATAEAYYHRGNVRYAQRDLAGAIEDYGRAIELDPGGWEAYANRGNAKMGLGDVKGAIADFDLAIERNASAAEPHVGRGIARRGLGNRKGAREDFDRAIELKKDYSEAYLMRAFVRDDAGDRAGAIADLEAAIRHAPAGWNSLELAKKFLSMLKRGW